MINENFKPAEWKYVETPYAEMLKHGMMQQANYDEAVGAMAEYDAKLGALKRIDESTYQNVVSKYDQDFRDMYDQYGGDWGAMKNRVKQRLGAETANPFYNLNRAHVEEYEKMQEFNKQLAANGKSPLTYSRLPMSLKKNGKYIDVKDIKYDIERKLEWDNKEREIAAFALQDETTGWAESLKSLNREDYVNKFIQRGKGSTTQIGMPQIDKKLDEMYTNFMDSDEGKQKYRALANSEEYKMKNATPADIEAKIKLDLLDTAKMKIHKSTTIDYDVMKNDDYGRGAKGTDVNRFNIATTNSTSKVNERPVSENSILGKIMKMQNPSGNDKNPAWVRMNMAQGKSIGRWVDNLLNIDSGSNSNGTSNQQSKEQELENTKIFNSIIQEGSSLSNIFKAYGVKTPAVVANFKDVKKIINDPVFKVAINTFDNLNKFYVGKDVVLNQNPKVQEGIDGVFQTMGEDYEFEDAKNPGKTIPIKKEDRAKADYRLDLTTGLVKVFTKDGNEIYLKPSEVQNTAGEAMKSMKQATDVFMSDQDGQPIVGAGGVVYETVDASRLVSNGQGVLNKKTGMVTIQTSSGPKQIPVSAKVVQSMVPDDKGRPQLVRYTYDDFMGGLTGQAFGAMGTNTTIETGKAQ